MKGKWFTAGLLAAVGVLAWAVPSRAGDVVRLNMVNNAPTQNLVDDGQGADTIRTWHRGFGWGGRGFGWGGYRGFGWGGYRGFGWGGYRGLGWGGYGLGYRGLGYGGFYRPYYGFGGFYRPFYGYGLGSGLGIGYGLGGIGYGGFYPGFGYGYGFGPCAGTTASVYTLSIPVATLGTPLNGAAQQPYVDVNPPQAPADAGTYPYDGGPRTPAPNSKEATPPTSTPKRTVPLEGRSVSLPKPAGKWAYPAYGEISRRTSSTQEQTVLTRGESKKPAAR